MTVGTPGLPLAPGPEREPTRSSDILRYATRPRPLARIVRELAAREADPEIRRRLRALAKPRKDRGRA